MEDGEVLPVGLRDDAAGLCLELLPSGTPPTSLTNGTLRPVRSPARGPDVLSQPSAHRVSGGARGGLWGRWHGARLHGLGDSLGKLGKHQGEEKPANEKMQLWAPRLTP